MFPDEISEELPFKKEPHEIDNNQKYADRVNQSLESSIPQVIGCLHGNT